MKTEIFLKAGDAADVKRLKELINRGEFSPTTPTSPHDVASLIKVQTYIRRWSYSTSFGLGLHQRAFSTTFLKKCFMMWILLKNALMPYNTFQIPIRCFWNGY